MLNRVATRSQLLTWRTRSIVNNVGTKSHRPLNQWSADGAHSFHLTSMCVRSLSTNNTPFKLADIGEGIAEVELLKWFVKEGDIIKAFDRVCEVQSDKATVEITSRYDGLVTKVHHTEGDMVQVGSTLVDIASSEQSGKVSNGSETAVAVAAAAGGGAAPLPISTTATTPTSSAPDASSVIPFKLADIGEGIAEVEMMKMFVQEGDIIKAFDRVCEVQSDKATVEITSRYDGLVTKVHHTEGDMVQVGGTLIDIAQGDSNSHLSNDGTLLHEGTGHSHGKLVSAQASDSRLHIPGVGINTGTATTGAATTTGATATRGPSTNSGGEKILTTPAVRRLARENDLDLSLVTASGPKGRITKEDVLLYLQNQYHAFPTGTRKPQATAAPPRVAPTTPSVSASTTSTTTTTAATNKATSQSASSAPIATTAAAAGATAPAIADAVPERVPIRGVQRLMLKTMSESREIQHLTYCEEVTFDKLRQLRESMRDTLMKTHSVKMSYMPLIIKATSLALRSHPILNASLTPEQDALIYHPHHHIGVAMDTPKGLIVPVIHHVEAKSIVDIAVELTQLQELAVSGGLTEANLTGGTFSLSNIGSIGGTYAAPVVVAPQVAIGALGRVQVLPRYVHPRTREPASHDDIFNGTAVVEPTSLMNISWGADHRVVEGATIARFSNQWRQYIENPQTMLAELR